MKKGLTVITLAIGLVVTVTLSTSQISLVSASPCSTEPTTIESTDGRSYTVLQFKTVGTCEWTVPSRVSVIDALVVAGGGGGGGTGGRSWSGGGGSGGSVVERSSYSLGNQTKVTVIVGSGGIGGSGTDRSDPSDFPQSGNDSSLGELTAKGGGPGGHAVVNSYGDNDAAAPKNGGGGGAQSNRFLGAVVEGSSPTRKGGDGFGSSTTGNQAAGGGAGAGSSGSNASSGVGGDGGLGISSSITGTPIPIFYGGGGGGGKRESASGRAGVGGDGGGGAGGRAGIGSPGLENTGGGGGGAGGSGWTGGAGGSGVVIVRYITPPTITETNGIVMLVDPRSESVPIPYLTVITGAPSRICFDLKSSDDDLLTLKTFSNANTDSDKFRMAVTFGDVTVGTDAKITASRANTPALLKRNASNSESYLRLYRPASGWSEVDGGKVKVRVDYAVDSDCSGVSGTEINVEIPIKVLEIGAIQKNPVDLSRG